MEAKKHERKISELVERICTKCGDAEIHPNDDDGVIRAVREKDLKQWAIAVVNWYCEYHDIKPFTTYWDIGRVRIKDCRKRPKGMISHNDAITIIKFLIEQVGITEEELK